jgi:hypothetical protein
MPGVRPHAQIDYSNSGMGNSSLYLSFWIEIQKNGFNSIFEVQEFTLL